MTHLDNKTLVIGSIRIPPDRTNKKKGEALIQIVQGGSWVTESPSYVLSEFRLHRSSDFIDSQNNFVPPHFNFVYVPEGEVLIVGHSQSFYIDYFYKTRGGFIQSMTPIDVMTNFKDSKIRGFAFFRAPLSQSAAQKLYQVNVNGGTCEIPFPPCLIVLDSEGQMFYYYFIDTRSIGLNDSLLVRTMSISAFKNYKPQPRKFIQTNKIFQEDRNTTSNRRSIVMDQVMGTKNSDVVPQSTQKNSQEQGSQPTLDSYYKNIPKDYLCPITLEIMENPVIVADGHSYERTAIENWLKNGAKKSPLTGQKLGHELIIENFTLKKVIDEYMKMQEMYQLGQLLKSAPVEVQDHHQEDSGEDSGEYSEDGDTRLISNIKFEKNSQPNSFFLSNLELCIISQSFSGWKGMRASTALSKSQNHSFEVRIDRLSNNQIIQIGICPDPHKDERRFNRNGSFSYCTSGGICVNGGTPHQTQTLYDGIDGYKAARYHKLTNCTGSKGKIIKICADFVETQVCFFFDDSLIFTSESINR